MTININIDSDDEGKIRLAVQGHVVPDWVYENSQVEHENKRVRLMRQHQQILEREAQQELQRKLQRKLQRRRQQVRQRQQQLTVSETKKKQVTKHSVPKKVIDDGLEF